MKNLFLTLIAVTSISVLVGCSSVPNKIQTPPISNEDYSKSFFLDKMNEYNAIDITNLSDDKYLEYKQCGIKLYEKAISYHLLWSAKEDYQLSNKLKQIKRDFYYKKLGLFLLDANKLIDTVKRPNEKIAACDRIIERLKIEKKREIWTFTEKSKINYNLIKFQQLKNGIKLRFDALLEKHKHILEQEQVKYVLEQGTLDLKTAYKIFRENNSKYFNWFWIGYWRNNMSMMRKGWSLCQRVSISPYSKYMMITQATEIQQKMRKIMSASQRESCISYPVKRYFKDTYFPNWSPLQAATDEFIRSEKKNKPFKLENKTMQLSFR